MKKWNKSLLIALVTGLLFGAAAPAHAQQVPFSATVPIPGTVGTGIGAFNQGTGFVGACDVALQCTGASVRVAHTAGKVEVTGMAIAVAGVICASDQTAPCGRAGDPGTGVVFTRRDLILGSSTVDIPDFVLEYCVWDQDPRFAPGSCTNIPVNTKSLVPVSTKTGPVPLGDLIPERVIVSGIGQS
jgi:hypothetical protein